MKNVRFGALALLSGGLGLLPASAADPQYDFVTLDFPGSVFSFPLGINNQRQIAGFYGDTNGILHGYLYSGGKFTTIDYPGGLMAPGAGTATGGINDRGDMAGVYTDQAGFQHGFRLTRPAECGNNGGGNNGDDRDGDKASCKPVFTPIDVPGAAETTGIPFEFGTGLGTNAISLNNQGDVTGFFATAGQFSDGFLLRKGSFTHIDHPSAAHVPGLGTKLFGINEQDALTGTYLTAPAGPGFPPIAHGFLLDDGKYMSIDVPGSAAGGFGTQANGMNNHGQVVGIYSAPDGSGHGFLWEKGKFTTIDFPGAPFNELHVVNDHGDLTGAYATDPAGQNIHGFMAIRK